MTKEVIIFGLLGTSYVLGGAASDRGPFSGNQTVKVEFPPIGGSFSLNVTNCTDPSMIDACAHDPAYCYPAPNEACITKCAEDKGCCIDEATATGFNNFCADEDNLAQKFHIAEGVFDGVGFLMWLYNYCKTKRYQSNDNWKSILGSSSLMMGMVGHVATAIGKRFGNVLLPSVVTLPCTFFTTFTANVLFKKVQNGRGVEERMYERLLNS